MPLQISNGRYPESVTLVAPVEDCVRLKVAMTQFTFAAGCTKDNRARKTRQRLHSPRCSEDLRSVECLQKGIRRVPIGAGLSATRCFQRYRWTNKDSSLPTQ